MVLHQFFAQSEVYNRMTSRKIPLSMTEKNQRMFVSGPRHSGQTSLLLQFAFNIAKETSGTVVFLCRRQNFENNALFLSQDIDPSSSIFERIQMKYIEDDEGLRKYFAAFHLHKEIPRAVIIHDFCDFFDERACEEKYGQSRGRDLASVRSLALCCDAIDYANTKLPAEEPCKFLVSDTNAGDTPRLLYIYQRWLTHILTIKAHDGFTFTLQGINTPNRKTLDGFAKYTIALQYLTLEELNCGLS
eukprot:TRINITY_DN15555_c0_g2_i2.p1 TRINITY_DN15555_c0_g2~~TRINITY_DN15555_c0_g2_i2.p1  ORF type:complete len:245 (-),score=26.97 TRINITY_DN15555_c0_g2_i2:49-783(-)